MTRRSILTEADQLVNGPRRTDYGDPAVNHARTAALWTAHIQQRYGVGIVLDSADVCWMNVAQKQARDMHAAKRDNLRDSAGYLANLDEIRGGE